MIQALVAVLLSGFLYYSSAGFHSLWLLMWFAPIPVLIYAYRHAFWPSVLVSFLVGLVPGLNLIIGYLPTPLPWTYFLSIIIPQALAWAAVVVLSRFFTRRIITSLSILAYPTLLALLEWLNSFGTWGTYNSIAYSQIHFLPIMQISSLTGYYGITFVISLVSSALAYSYTFYLRKVDIKLALSLAFVVLFMTLAYGWIQLFQVPKEKAPQALVGLAAINPPENQVYDTTDPQDTLTEYSTLIANLAKQGAQIVLMPENTLSLTTAQRVPTLTALSEIAKQNHVMLIIGIYENLGTQKRNAAWVFDKNGAFIGEYHKQQPLPKLEEGLMPGQDLVMFDFDGSVAGVAISRDMAFVNPSYQYGVDQADILFVPAHDADIEAELPIEAAITRGIENDFTVARASKFGLLMVSSPNGKILGETKATGPGQATLLVNAPIGTSVTLYDRFGNWFAKVLMVLILLLLFRSVFHRKDNPF